MLKIVKNLWTVRAAPRTPLGELTALPALAGGEVLLPSPQEPTPLSAFTFYPNENLGLALV